MLSLNFNKTFRSASEIEFKSIELNFERVLETFMTNSLASRISDDLKRFHGLISLPDSSLICLSDSMLNV